MSSEEAKSVLAGRYRICVSDSLENTIYAEEINEAIDLAIEALEKQDIIEEYLADINDNEIKSHLEVGNERTLQWLTRWKEAFMNQLKADKGVMKNE